MPSPFPGMDPYLEDPIIWPNVHTTLVAEMRTALNRHLRPKYIAVVEERVFVSEEPDEDRPGRATIRIPDIHVRDFAAGPAPRAAGGIAAPVRFRAMTRIRVRERRVEILAAASRDVVTVIELLSPSNKRPGDGRQSYLKKRRAVLRSRAHLVEIDLLRGGHGTFSRRRVPECEYAVSASPIDIRPDGLVWPIRLTDPLPIIGIPLRDPDPPAPLDLQAVFAEAYDRGSFDGLANYAATPDPPLTRAETEWATAILAAGRGG